MEKVSVTLLFVSTFCVDELTFDLVFILRFLIMLLFLLRRFLRRNRSIMADVAMGQVLNTVTCPICTFSSRNFDPFNLLSIPIPTVSDVVFQCTVYRRATPLNCPWVLNKPRKGDYRPARYIRRIDTASRTSSQSEKYVAEQYVISMSRLADSGDLRLQIQNLSGIPAHRLKLCRAESFVINKDAPHNSVVRRQTKMETLRLGVSRTRAIDDDVTDGNGEC